METDGPTSRWLSSTVICVYMSSVMFLQAVTHASSQKVWNKQISIMTWRWQTCQRYPVRPCFPCGGPRSAPRTPRRWFWAWRALWRVVCSPSDSSPPPTAAPHTSASSRSAVCPASAASYPALRPHCSPAGGTVITSTPLPGRICESGLCRIACQSLTFIRPVNS